MLINKIYCHGAPKSVPTNYKSNDSRINVLRFHLLERTAPCIRSQNEETAPISDVFLFGKTADNIINFILNKYKYLFVFRLLYAS